MPRVILKGIFPKAKELIRVKPIRKELENALDHTANIIRDDFRKTTRTWNNKPTFKKTKIQRKIDSLRVEVFANNEIYYYVTRGTRAHMISAVRAPRLSFQTGFRSKSRVRIIGSRAGSRSGPRVYAKQVSHPGTKAREFDLEIERRRQKNLTNLVRLAINRSVRVKVS